MRPGPAAALAGIDWSLPWLAPYRAPGRRVEARLVGGLAVAEALNAELDARPLRLAAGPLRFVPQVELPPGVAYEAHIAATARVPTRDNRHDLFNGLVWLAFPRLKRHLNELQAAQLQAGGVGPTRGALRDALTLFDENAAWLQAPVELSEALARRDWSALFLQHRAAWAGASLTLFGHALLDKLTAPRKAITAHVWVLPPGPVPTPSSSPATVEDRLCELLTPGRLATRSHLPLPVLGVPGWWAGNEAPGFYDDAEVFRPARSAGPARQPAGAPG